ncbi:hypothetical protein JX266_014107 [Neoarthrinium moseri]|nr:hypothetical protein JX266_014107 [Neoarthrinium moseri]
MNPQTTRVQPAQQQGMSATRTRSNTNRSVLSNHGTALRNIQTTAPSRSINQPMRAGQSGLSTLPDIAEDEELDSVFQMQDQLEQIHTRIDQLSVAIQRLSSQSAAAMKRLDTNMAQGFRQQSNDTETLITGLKDGLEQYAATQNQESFMDLLGEDQFNQE